MSDAGFVTHINNPDSFTGSYGQNLVEVIAHQGKDGVDSQLYDGPHEQLGAVWHRTAMLLQS